MILLSTFIDWLTNHRLFGEIVAIAIFVILVGTWIGVGYTKHKKQIAEQEAKKMALKNKAIRK
jgi:hypothetical protein